MSIAWLVLQSATWWEEDVELETSSDWRSWVSSSKKSTARNFLKVEQKSFTWNSQVSGVGRFICSFLLPFLFYKLHSCFNLSSFLLNFIHVSSDKVNRPQTHGYCKECTGTSVIFHSLLGCRKHGKKRNWILRVLFLATWL